MPLVDRKHRINDAVVSAELDQEAVLLNVEAGTYFGLDAVGTRIWQLLEQGLCEEDICNTLFDEYDVDLAQVKQDVSEFLERLAAHGLLQPEHV